MSRAVVDLCLKVGEVQVPPITVGDRRSNYGAVIFWLILYTATLSASALFASSLSLGPEVLVPPALVALAFSTWGFIRQGGVLLNASSIYSYATALFLAFPAVYAGLGDGPSVTQIRTDILVGSLSLSVALQAGVLLVCDPGPRGVNCAKPGAAPSTVRRFTLIGAIFGSAVLARRNDLDLGIGLSTSLGVLAVLLCADVALRVDAHYRVLGGVALVGCSLGYYDLLFVGFGRLSLGALTCAVALIASIGLRTYIPKAAILLATAPAVAFLVQERIAFLEQIRVSSVNAKEGIESLVGPYVSLCKILQAAVDGRISPTLGSSIWATATFWIPRDYWASKPMGFGAEIIPITQIRLILAPGYSDAATVVGEMIWNLGAFVFVGAAALVLWLRMLDRIVMRIALQPGRFAGPVGTAKRLLVVLLVSGVLNLVWGGTFTYVTRFFGAAALLIAALSVYAFLRTTIWRYGRGRLHPSPADRAVR